MLSTKAVSFPDSLSVLKSIKTLNSGNELAISSPLELRILPRVGKIGTLSFFCFAATSNQ